jgi:tetratricopeptide (TPR) repeat protein
LSLLQDALPKAQKGQGGDAKQAGSPLPGAGGPAPSRSTWFWGGLVLAAVFLLGAAVVTVLVRPSREGPQGALQPVSPVSDPAPPVAPSPPPAVSAPATGGPGGDARLSAPEAVRQTGPAATTAPPRAHALSAGPAAARATPRVSAHPSSDAPREDARPATSQPMPAASTGGKVSQLARFNEGVAAQERGDWEAAARLFREVVSKEPSIVEGWSGLGNALLRQGKLPEADRALRKALSLDPNYPAAHERRPAFGRAGRGGRGLSPGQSLDFATRRLNRHAQASREPLRRRRRPWRSARVPVQRGDLYHLGRCTSGTGNRDRRGKRTLLPCVLRRAMALPGATRTGEPESSVTVESRNFSRVVT